MKGFLFRSQVGSRPEGQVVRERNRKFRTSRKDLVSTGKGFKVELLPTPHPPPPHKHTLLNYTSHPLS